MFSSKSLLFLASLLLVAIAAFIIFTGPLPINGLAGLVKNNLGSQSTGEYLEPAVAIQDTGTIMSYRMRMTLNNVGSDRWPDYVTGEGSYVIAPRAEEITVIYEEGENSQRVAMTVISDTYYLQDGDVVIQTPESAIDLLQITLIDPQSLTTLANNFIQIGEEAINDRSTIHYQGDPDLLPAESAAALVIFGTATIDLWVDNEENFIVAMAIRAYGVNDNPDANYELRVDYFDFNNPDIVITAPELTDFAKQG